VSKQPVMEALRRLSADGMVEIVPQVGSLVAVHEPRETDDFYLMFSGFEGAIAGIAANTSGVPQPLSSALDDRHDDHERIRAALHAGDQNTARAEMEQHIVGTSSVMQAAPHPQRGG
jgi:DNA-binding GntR family transcriptional regulator